MDLRHYLEIARRRKWTIIECVVVVAIAAALLTSMRTPTYRSTSRVLLQPNDPTETLNGNSIYFDPDRYLSAQADIIQSAPVAAEAAKQVNGASGPTIGGQVAVNKDPSADILNITATDLDPVRARDIANAFARAYIQNRKDYAIADLKRVSDELTKKLADLQSQIADYDTKIGDGGIKPGATVGLVQPSNQGAPTGGPTAPSTPTLEAPVVDAGLTGPASTNEGLKAARYAAAVQYQSLYSRQQELLVDMSLKRGSAQLITEAQTPSRPIGATPKRNGALGAVLGLVLGLGMAVLREQLDDRVHSREEAERITGLPVLAELPLDEESSKNPTHLAAVERPMSTLAEATRSLRTSIHFLSIDESIRRILITSAGPRDGKSTVAANLATVYAQAGYRTVLVSGDVRRPRAEALLGIEVPTAGLTELVASLAGSQQLLDPALPVHPTGNGNGNGNGHSAVAEEPFARTRELLRSTARAAVGVPTPPPRPAPVRASDPIRRRAVQRALVKTRIENLMVLPAGAQPPNPAELLGSRKTAEVLDELSQIADIIIIDTPPVLAVTDPVVLAAKADGVVLVNALGGTRRGAIKRTKATLDGTHTRILGMVLNKLDGWDESSYYSYYGYSRTTGQPRLTRKERKAVRTTAKADQKAARQDAENKQQVEAGAGGGR
ncbi:MAG: hypothetical protein JWO37_31 [Acidimicrobiales bacterium]|nr:hypothetical protein [Acidimicrobiales bacterium]